MREKKRKRYEAPFELVSENVIAQCLFRELQILEEASKECSYKLLPEIATAMAKVAEWTQPRRL